MKTNRGTARCLLACVLALIATSTYAADQAHSLVVSAGDFDRSEAVVELRVPSDLKDGVYALRDEQGHAMPFQVRGGHGWIILHELKAGQRQTYTIGAMEQSRADKGVEVKPADGAIAVAIDGHPAFTYQGEKTPLPAGYPPELKRGGYIHPVLTPAGKLVTDDYPKNHKHHHGIWTPWTKTEFEGRHPDFWNMSDKTGTVEPVSSGDVFSGPVCGGFEAKHQMVDLTAKPKPKPAIDEQWRVIAYNAGAHASKPYHVFDLIIHQEPSGSSPLTLPKYHYGGLGFRGSKDWNGKDGCDFLTSEGKTRANGNETRGRWCCVSGKVDGKEAGIAIFDHPDNLRSPQPLRLNPDMPFVCYAPEQLGAFQIAPGKQYDARYRFIVFDGPVYTNQINQLWNDYAKPAIAEVK